MSPVQASANRGTSTARTPTDRTTHMDGLFRKLPGAGGGVQTRTGVAVCAFETFINAPCVLKRPKFRSRWQLIRHAIVIDFSRHRFVNSDRDSGGCARHILLGNQKSHIEYRKNKRGFREQVR